MTGDAQKFSHISVASDDEDDVVIEAGAPRFRSYGEGEPAAQPAGDEATSAANKTAAADGGEGPSESPSRASTPAPERAAKADKPARKGYEETTLEDLEGTKMSGMQKGIIAVALIGIAAFIVYYVAFMG